MYNKTEQEIMKNWKGDIANPVVSVCTITYNHGMFISEAIDSFLMQETDFVFEVLIDDDCSTDNTRNIIKEYQLKYPNIIKPLLREQNVGSTTNFVQNVQRATGEYIALCEGDDYWTDPKKLQLQKESLGNNKNFSCAYHDILVVSKNDEISPESIYPDSLKRNFSSYEMMCCSCGAPTQTLFFRNIIDFPAEFQYVLNGDTFLISILGQHGKGYYMQEVLPSVYRFHSGGIWSSKTVQVRRGMQLTTFYWISEYYKRLGTYPAVVDTLRRGICSVVLTDLSKIQKVNFYLGIFFFAAKNFIKRSINY